QWCLIVVGVSSGGEAVSWVSGGGGWKVGEHHGCGFLLGKVVEVRGSSVRVVEWAGKEGGGVLEHGGKNVTAASTTITAADVLISAATTAAAPTLTTAPSRRIKGVVIKDPQETTPTSSTIIHSKSKSKDKGKGILVKEPKPLKKQAQNKQDEKYARELEAELNKNIDWDEVIDHVKRKQKKDNGMYYDDIRPIFEKHFDSNVAFLQKTKEQMYEEDSRALKRLNESQEEKAAKKQKLDEDVEEIKRHLQIVPNDEDDIYTEATPLARKFPIVDYEIYNENNKPYYKIKRADSSHQLYLSFLTRYTCSNLEKSKKCSWLSKSQEMEAVGILWCADNHIYNNTVDFAGRKEISTHKAWDRYKDLLRACPHHGFTKLHQLDTFYNALNPVDQDSLNSAAGGNLLKRRTQDVLKIIENKSKVRNSRNKSIVSQVKSSDANSSSSFEIAKLTHAVNQQTSTVTTAMTAILKQFQATLPPASVKVVEEICVTCGDAHLYYQCLAAGGNTFPELRDNIQGYVAAAAVNYNQGSGSLPSNTIANPKGELKAIATRSGIVLYGPSVLILPLFINPEKDERAKDTLTDQDLAEYTIKVPPPLVQKPKPPSQRNFVAHQRDPLHPNIPLSFKDAQAKAARKT
nr:hypothetical protein [Tanacetum cinerariifolium]